MKKGVGSQLPELNPIRERKAPKEFVRRKRKTSKKIRKKNDGKTRRRVRAFIGTWHDDISLCAGDEA